MLLLDSQSNMSLRVLFRKPKSFRGFMGPLKILTQYHCKLVVDCVSLLCAWKQILFHLLFLVQHNTQNILYITKHSVIGS